MHKKKTSVRKSMPEKQQSESEDKKNQRKEHHSSKKSSSSSKNNNALSTPEKHIHFEPNCRTCHKTDTLEASSSLPRETTTNCGKHEKSTGVSIKDVGIDIAGFLIEEEIRQNKEKLKLEIIRQIALSRELDKHLERQRHIMNNYICNNTLEGTKNGCPMQNVNDFNEKCTCMVCQEAAMENVSTSTSTCVRKSDVSEKSLQVNRTGSASGNTIPEFENNFTQSTPQTRRSISGFENSSTQPPPGTKDASCQGRKFSNSFQQCNEPNKTEKGQITDSKRADIYQPNDTASAVTRNKEQYSPQYIEGYIEDYSCTLNEKSENMTNHCDQYTTPDVTDAVGDVSTNIQKFDEFNKPKEATTEAPDRKSSNLKRKENVTEMTDETLNNLNNLLKTPLNTIEPQGAYHKTVGEDPTEIILSNIKNIIRDYMENININCTKCKLGPSTSKDEKKSNSSNSNEDSPYSSPVSAKKSDISTKCENDGTHIDIVMQFCESNNKKRAILEIEPCFDEKRCMKFAKKKCTKKKACDDMNICTKCCPSSCSQMSVCKSQHSNMSNCSRKFSPYPLKDRTAYRKSSKPKLICRSRKPTENYCRQKKCAAIKARKRSSNISCSSSNPSIEIIKVNRHCKTPICESSSSDSVVRKTCKLKKTNTKKQCHKGLTFCRKKSTICTYVSNMGGYSIEQSKQTGKNSREHTFIPVRNHDHKNNRKFDHQQQKAKIEQSLNPFVETTRKDKKHGRTPESTCSFESSNLDETSYREIQMNQRSKHSRKGSKSRRTSNTCTTISLSLEDLNFDVLGKCTGKQENNTLYACPLDIIPISEQWPINRFQDKDELLTSSNRPRNTNHLNKRTKQRRRRSVKDSRNVAFDELLHASSSSDPSIYNSSKRIQKHGVKFKTDIRHRPKEVESDTSIDESQPIEKIKTYTKISSDGGVVIVSPLFESRRIQLINNWMSYIHKLQAKENFKSSSPTVVAIKLPNSSKYVLPNEDSDQQLEYLLKPKSAVSHQCADRNVTSKVKESEFGKFNCPNDTKKMVFQVRNSSKWPMFQKDKKEMGFEDQVKKTTLKQSNNKNTGLDLNKSKSEVLHTDSSSSSEYIIGSSLSDSSFETTSESILDVNENNHDELIQELICPNRNNFKGKYFDVGETDRIINRAFYIQDIFVKLASTDEEREYWRDTVLRAMKNIVTKTS